MYSEYTNRRLRALFEVFIWVMMPSDNVVLNAIDESIIHHNKEIYRKYIVFNHKYHNHIHFLIVYKIF